MSKLYFYGVVKKGEPLKIYCDDIMQSLLQSEYITTTNEMEHVKITIESNEKEMKTAKQLAFYYGVLVYAWKNHRLIADGEIINKDIADAELKERNNFAEYQYSEALCFQPLVAKKKRDCTMQEMKIYIEKARLFLLEIGALTEKQCERYMNEYKYEISTE